MSAVIPMVTITIKSCLRFMMQNYLIFTTILYARLICVNNQPNSKPSCVKSTILCRKNKNSCYFFQLLTSLKVATETYKDFAIVYLRTPFLMQPGLNPAA